MKERLPHWFKQKIPDPEIIHAMKGFLDAGECFSRKTATFLILGDVCTRRCTFCAVKKGIPIPVDQDEPQHVLEATKKLNLQYVVVTSVTRDDLADGGASQFAKTIEVLHEHSSIPEAL